MKTTIVLCSSNRGLFAPTRRLVNELKRAGALYLEQTGASCVALARNLALTSACEAFDDAPRADMLLMLDDDIDAAPDQVEALIGLAREHGRPVSAMYTNADGSLAHSASLLGPGLWLSGLGLIAIPRHKVMALRSSAEVFSNGKRHRVYAFTEAKMHVGRWMSEDYTLSMRLGGVLLAPVPVGHLKVQSLYPNAMQVHEVAERFKEGEAGNGTH
jgi:hypothetical protein